MINLKLTLKEAQELLLIVGNSWGDGDFQGYGGAHVPTQFRAMRKLETAIGEEQARKK